MASDESDSKGNGVDIDYVCNDPVILEAFKDVKTAILAKRNDIVRQILSAAQSMREEDEYDSDGEERNKKELCDKYDSEIYVDLLSLLLCHRDTDSGTLLHYATRMDIADIARTLLAAGANATIKNNEGCTPYEYCQSDSMKNAYIGELMRAVSQSRTFRVQQLLSAGLDVNSSDGARSGNTILHWAASFADLSTLKLLLDKGADVNALNSEGVSPLHDGIQRGDKGLIQELLQHGANLQIRPHKGKYEGITAIELASRNYVLSELLEQYINEEEEITVCENGVEDVDDEDTSADEISASLQKEKQRKRHSSASLQSIIQRPTLLPPAQSLDESIKYLCPPPRKIRQFKGLGFVPPKDMTVVVTASDQACAVKEIFEIFENKFTNMGIKLSFQYTNNGLRNEKATHLHCITNKHICGRLEEYKIQINTHKVTILSSTVESMFRGISTFLQCLQLFRGKAVPLLQISDWSSCSVRSANLDFHDNDIPTIDVLCEAVNLLALFKINQLQLNTKHITSHHSDTTYYSKREFFNLQTYCRKRYIQLVPHIKINEESTLWVGSETDHPYINVVLVDDILDQFHGLNTLHVEINHTDSTQILQQLHYFCLNRNIQLQVSTDNFDMNLQQATHLLNGFLGTANVENIHEIPEKIDFYDTTGTSTILCYDTDSFDSITNYYLNILPFDKTVNEMTTLIYQSFMDHLKIWLCKFLTKCMTTLSSNTEILPDGNKMVIHDLINNRIVLYPNIEEIAINAHQIATQLSIYNCDGFAINLSYPSRRICNFSTCLPALIIATSFGWNCFSEITASLLENIINYLIYEDDSDITGGCFIKLGQTLPLLSNKRIIFDEMLIGSTVDYSNLLNEQLQEICRILKISRQYMSKVKLHSPLMSLITEESINILNLLFFLSRICYGLLSLQPKIVSPTISDLTDVHKSDNSNRLMTLIGEYETYCQKYYKNSDKPSVPSTIESTDFISVSLLKEFLQKILPPANNQLQAPGLFGVFTV